MEERVAGGGGGWGVVDTRLCLVQDPITEDYRQPEGRHLSHFSGKQVA